MKTLPYSKVVLRDTSRSNAERRTATSTPSTACPAIHRNDHTMPTHRNLEEALQAAGDTVGLLRNAQTAPYVYPVIPPEYTNWRDEQRAWQNTCVLFNQCYHMMECFIEGPDAIRLFSDLGVNS